MPWVAPPPLPVLPDQFVQMIAGLRQVLAERAVERHRAGDAAAVLLLNFICARLGRLAQRFVRLVAAVQAGRLPADRAGRRRAEPDAEPPPAASPGAGTRKPAPSRKPAPAPEHRLSRAFGWLLRLAPGYRTAAYHAYLQQWLAEPEVKAFLEEAPQAGRMLRWLCRMLMVELPPELRLPKRKPKAPPAAAPAIADAPPPDAPPAAPRPPGPGAGVARWFPSPELAQLSDEELERRLAEARARLALVPKPDRSQPA